MSQNYSLELQVLRIAADISKCQQNASGVCQAYVYEAETPPLYQCAVQLLNRGCFHGLVVPSFGGSVMYVRSLTPSGEARLQQLESEK